MPLSDVRPKTLKEQNLYLVFRGKVRDNSYLEEKMVECKDAE